MSQFGDSFSADPPFRGGPDASRIRTVTSEGAPPRPMVGINGTGEGAFPQPKMYRSTRARSRARIHRIHQGFTQVGTATAANISPAQTMASAIPHPGDHDRYPVLHCVMNAAVAAVAHVDIGQRQQPIVGEIGRDLNVRRQRMRQRRHLTTAGAHYDEHILVREPAMVGAMSSS